MFLLFKYIILYIYDKIKLRKKEKEEKEDIFYSNYRTFYRSCCNEKLCSSSKVCIPYLKKSANPHIVNISPPLNMKAIWFKNHVAYTIAKYGMSMCVLGMAEEFKPDGIAVNAVWPKTGMLLISYFIDFQ